MLKTSRRRAPLLAPERVSPSVLLRCLCHDLNNLLMVISATAEFLQSGYGEPRAHAERLAEASNIARRLVQALSTVQAEPELTPVPVAGAVSAALRLADPRRPTLVEAAVRIAPSMVVLADRTQLELALFNLIINAYEAMEDRAGDVTVSATRRHREVAITVRDSGPGLPAEVRDRLFTTRVTTKTHEACHGFGLLATHAVITGMGGQLAVDSAQESGTAFTITLPAAG